MGRGKIEIKRIENPTNRQVTFSKRRGGLLKKAHELAILCDAQVGVVVFSASGKMFEYCSQPMSMKHLIDRYQRVTNTRFNEIDNHQQIIGEIARMKHENERLQLSMRQYTGDDLSSFTMDDLSQLEQQLEFSVNKVRERKHQLLNQQLDNLRRKEHILEDQNSYMYRVISENQHALPDVKVADQMPLLDHFGNFYQTDEESSRPLLQLNPYRLQPIQPNLHHDQSTSLPGHSLQL